MPMLDRPCCCMCRERDDLVAATWPFPEDSLRCANARACRGRVRSIVKAHRELAAALGSLS